MPMPSPRNSLMLPDSTSHRSSLATSTNTPGLTPPSLAPPTQPTRATCPSTTSSPVGLMTTVSPSFPLQDPSFRLLPPCPSHHRRLHPPPQTFLLLVHQTFLHPPFPRRPNMAPSLLAQMHPTLLLSRHRPDIHLLLRPPPSRHVRSLLHSFWLSQPRRTHRIFPHSDHQIRHLTPLNPQWAPRLSPLSQLQDGPHPSLSCVPPNPPTSRPLLLPQTHPQGSPGCHCLLHRQHLHQSSIATTWFQSRPQTTHSLQS